MDCTLQRLRAATARLLLSLYRRSEAPEITYSYTGLCGTLQARQRVRDGAPAANDFWTFYSQLYAILRAFSALWQLSINENKTEI